MIPRAFDHVAFAVHNLEEAIQQYQKLLKVEVAHRERIEEQGVEEALLRVGESYIQLLQPIRADSPVGKFLEKKGPGIHHVGYRVDSVEEAILQFKAAGARLIDERPRRGSRNTKIAFVHPAAMGGVLVELVQECDEPDSHH